MIKIVKKWLQRNRDNASSAQVRGAELDEQSEAPESGKSQDVDYTEMTLDVIPLDFSLAVKEFMGNQALVEKTLKSFVEVCDKQLAQFYVDYENGNYQNIGAEAHKIKGGAANITAYQLSETAKKLEDAVDDKQVACLSELIDEFSHRLRVFKETLQELNIGE